MKKLFCIITLILAVIAAGCGIQEEFKGAALKKDNDTVTLASYRHLAPGNKDAYYCSSSLGVWEPLITKDKDNKPVPCLAQSWEMQENGKVWIFHLRKNIFFHNGTNFNADAVIANFDRMKKGTKRSTFYGMNIDVYYPSLLKYEKIYEYTFKLTFKEANINELYKMTDFGSPIYAPECFAEDGNFKTLAIGTGPYKIVENKLNSYVTIEKNDNYWGEKGKIKRFVVRKIPNTDTRYAALKSGEVDGVIDLNAVPPFLAEELTKDKNFVVYKNKSTMVRYLALNGKKFPFNDVRMRQAVSLAIDRQNLVDALYMGYARPTVNILNYCSSGYKKFPVKYDKQEAQRLAREVLGDKRVEVVYGIYGSEPLQKGEAEIIAYWLKDIGLDVKIKVLEYATLLKMIRKGECDIARLQKGLANGDPYTALYPFVMPDGALNKNNSVNYKNDRIVELMNRVKHITDEQERQNIFDEIQEIAVEEQPVVPLFNDMAIVATNKRLKNYGAINQIELASDYN